MEQVQCQTLDNTIWFKFIIDTCDFEPNGLWAIQFTSFNCDIDSINDIGNGGTQLALYSGNCQDLTPVICIDIPGFNSSIGILDFAFLSGTQYYLMLDGDGSNSFGGLAEGEFCFEISPICLPGTIGIEQSITTKDFNVFPNPSWDNLFIDNLNFIPRNIQMFDAFGREVILPKSFSSEYYSLDVSEIPEGLYFITLYTIDNQFVVKKFIKSAR